LFKKKWSCCPWCDVEYENEEEALLHWFDENHAIVSCRNIIGEKDGCVNDARLFDGLALPYTPFIQASIVLYAQLAPLASIILSQKVTKIDLANTNELPACLSVEIANMEPSNYWLPDCATCNTRFYRHNVVHYSSIGAYDPDSEFVLQKCGHYVPHITKKYLNTIGLSLFQDMVDKMSGKKKNIVVFHIKQWLKKMNMMMKARCANAFQHYFKIIYL